MDLALVEVQPAFWTRVTADQIINDKATVLYGVQAYSAQTGGQFVIRDGQNEYAPVFATIDIAAGRSKNIVISRGVLLVHGLYIDLGDNITEVTVAWVPYTEPVRVSGERALPGG